MFLLVKFLKPLKYNKMDSFHKASWSRFKIFEVKPQRRSLPSAINDYLLSPLDKPLFFLKHGSWQCFPSKVPQIPLQIGKCKSWMSHLDGYGQAFYNLIKRFQLVRSVFYVWCRSLHTSFVFVSINLSCDHLLSLMPNQCRITNCDSAFPKPIQQIFPPSPYCNMQLTKVLKGSLLQDLEINVCWSYSICLWSC